MIEAFYQLLDELFHYTHPIHPPVAHMPIGLIGGVFLLGLIAFVLRRMVLPMLSYHRIMLAAFVFAFLTILFGYMDWRHFYEGEWIFAIKVKLALSAVLVLLLFLSVLMGRRPGASFKGVYVVYSLCFFVVVGLGYFGGQLAYEEIGYIPKEFKRGRSSFEANCGGCHPNGEGTVDVPQLAKPDEFLAFLRNPAAADTQMPAFQPGQLPEKKVRQINQYLNLLQCVGRVDSAPEQHSSR